MASFFVSPFLHPTLDVVLGPRVVDHPGDHDVPERGVGLAVATAVEAMAFVLAARGIERSTPQRWAKVASFLSRSGLSPAATRRAEATSVPTPRWRTSPERSRPRAASGWRRSL